MNFLLLPEYDQTGPMPEEAIRELLDGFPSV
jgi:hypothetical protein